MTQWLKALSAPPKDLGLIPSTHEEVNTDFCSSSRGTDTLQPFAGTVFTCYTDIHTRQDMHMAQRCTYKTRHAHGIQTYTQGKACTWDTYIQDKACAWDTDMHARHDICMVHRHVCKARHAHG